MTVRGSFSGPGLIDLEIYPFFQASSKQVSHLENQTFILTLFVIHISLLHDSSYPPSLVARTGPLYGPIFPKPHLLLIAPKRRRDHTIDLPQSPIRFINMVFPVVAFIGNMWLQKCVDSRSGAIICLV